MSWSPTSAGDGSPSHHTFTTDSGVFSLVGLSNGNIALHLLDVNTQQLYICTGAWSIQGDGSAGKADFTPSVADIATGTGPFGRAALYKAYPVVTLSSGPKSMDAQYLQVIAAP